MDEHENPYDAVPYPVLSHSETHPDRIATVALLVGLEPAPVDHCRVLEIGAASGGNLVPMAAGLPGSEFVGLDYSAVQVAAARSIAAEAGLGNIRFECADVRDFDPRDERFDYVIAHGVYSWLPPDARDALLALCGRVLSEHGVAYISYNTLPGWSSMLALREVMLLGARQATSPRKRLAQATETVRLLKEHAREGSQLAAVLEGALALEGARSSMGGTDSSALTLHDHLEEHNHPVYLYQFAEHAARHGLDYLGDAVFASLFPRTLSREAIAAIADRTETQVEFEQYIDWLEDRAFRRTLLCRDASSIRSSLRADPPTMNRLRARSMARPEGSIHLADDSAATFVSARGGKLTTNHPLSKAALVELDDAYPASVPVAELPARAVARLAAQGIEAAATDDDVAMIGANLLQGFSYDAGLVELRTWEPSIVTAVSGRPLASAYVRTLVERTATVANAYHERVNLQMPQAALLTLLDGTRDRKALVEAMSELVAPASSEGADLPSLDALIEETLEFFAGAALLVG
jgi:methyltransferase-like protein/2-polyprenyl-3-methyl-5-hydroxy-6-metoxy-1,4-benzoquinol methylase